MKKVERFKCEYCNKLTAKEETMKKHETECIHNPNSINCFRCEFAYIGDYDLYGYSTTKDVPICVYSEEMMKHNEAATCSTFKRSDKLYHERSYEEAEKALDLYREQKGE